MRKVRYCLYSLTAGVVLSTSIHAWAVPFNQTNLVSSDLVAHPAPIGDPDIKNAWGMSFGPSNPFWISGNGSGKSVIYSVDPVTQVPTQQPLKVTIPGNGSVTGQVFNSNAASFNGNQFLFVSEDGTVSGWRPALGSTAEAIAPASSANVYKGVALGSVGGNDYMYAANFRAGTIDVHKGVNGAPSLPGSFSDPTLPAGYAPFNIQNLDGSLYVAYAKQDADKSDEVSGPGTGFVDKFSLSGDFIGRVASGGALDAPWGMAIAPSSFGNMAGDLLVGNFGDGHINVYDATTHAFLGQVTGANNSPLAVDGLWAISPGNDGSAGSSHLLYFTAGPDSEANGLFGVLTPVPEPSEYAMMLAGLGVLALLIRRRTPTPS
ncbi:MULTISPECIES: TIGR03118 family protein [unclassified Nitrosospira]|uniref:TIGR03118 family protein n=1 Tax=unclassified Nitrosospira TaxID=2609267 RepID=UPI000D307CE7|nr:MULTISPECIES: TIGR03118 family protein [unclassified Nitrosospira]PTR17594.1 uncharacterized protein (TIGR03118 family) [Nitrosospira sp. Nsp2]WON74096.1 TIGR03118 family protein [Nitrosospira sp. Is2]